MKVYSIEDNDDIERTRPGQPGYHQPADKTNHWEPMEVAPAPKPTKSLLPKPVFTTAPMDLPPGWRKITNKNELLGILANYNMDGKLPELIEPGDEVFADTALGIVVVLNPKSGEIKKVSYPDEKPQDPAKVPPKEKAKATARIRQVQKLAEKKKAKKYGQMCICNAPGCRIGPMHPIEMK